MQKSVKTITFEISHEQALELFGILDSADESKYSHSLTAIYDRLHQIATDRYTSKQIG